MGNNRKSSLKKSSPSPKYLGIALIVVVIFILYVLLNKLFKVNSIVCKQNHQPCSEATISKLSHLENSSMFFTDFDKTLSQFSEYKVSKKLPSTLILELSKAQSNYYQLGEDGRVTITKEEVLEKDLNEKINILFTDLTLYEIKYDKILLSSEVLTVYLPNNRRSLIDINDVKSGAHKLNQVLKHIEFNEIDTAIKEIDTRFKMPVLKTKHSVI